MATSRRNFLFGRRTPPSAWGQFCSRLSRTTQGALRWDADGKMRVASLMPAREADVLHAQALCREYGVRMWLQGLPLAAGTDQAVLWVEAGSAWASVAPLEMSADAPEVWRVDAGYRIAGLHAHDFEWLQNVNPAWSIAEWLSSEASSQWPYAQGASSGIVKARVLLADGTIAVLGPFGTRATEALSSLTLQKLVPRFFEMTQSPLIRELEEPVAWPGRLRLDALMPKNVQEVNLARLLAGHGGSLAWLLNIWLEKKPSATVKSVASKTIETAGVEPGDPVSGSAGLPNQPDLSWLDDQLKEAFDPFELFAPVPGPKGLESTSLSGEPAGA